MWHFVWLNFVVDCCWYEIQFVPGILCSQFCIYPPYECLYQSVRVCNSRNKYEDETLHIRLCWSTCSHEILFWYDEMLLLLTCFNQRDFLANYVNDFPGMFLLCWTPDTPVMYIVRCRYQLIPFSNYPPEVIALCLLLLSPRDTD